MDYSPSRDHAGGRSEAAIFGVDLSRLLVSFLYVVFRVRYLRIRGIADGVPGETWNTLECFGHHRVAHLANASKPFKLVVIRRVVKGEDIRGHDRIGGRMEYSGRASGIGHSGCIDLKQCRS